MENLFGKITASLVEKDQSYPEGLIEKINNNIAPPEKVTANDVYIRAMYIVSDQVNSLGGCFPIDEHEKLIELIVDSPVLIGHRKDSLPIARNFYAEKIRKAGTNWIKVYFYWLKTAEGGESLKSNIDGGIYKECSISFIFSFPECTICGDDSRRCEHRPFSIYKTSDGTEREAAFNYRQIEKVLETSLVYRGSVPDTSITKELFFGSEKSNPIDSTREKNKIPVIKRIWELSKVDSQGTYLVMPAYESLRVIMERNDEGIRFFYPAGSEIKSGRLSDHINHLNLTETDYTCDCRLIGYRGKERQKVSELVKYLDGAKSKVKRIELKIYDKLGSGGGSTRREELEKLFPNSRDLLAPAETTSGKNLTEALKKVSTKYGLEIMDCNSTDRYVLTFRKQASFVVKSGEKSGSTFRYELLCYDRIGEREVKDILKTKLELSKGEVIELGLSSIRLTGDGIELVHPQVIDHYSYQGVIDNSELLLENEPVGKLPSRYAISKLDDSDVLFSYESGGGKESFIIHNFSRRLLTAKRRFLSDKVEQSYKNDQSVLLHGDVEYRIAPDNALVLYLRGSLEGTFVFRPVLLKETGRYLFCKNESILANGIRNE